MRRASALLSRQETAQVPSLDPHAPPGVLRGVRSALRAAKRRAEDVEALRNGRRCASSRRSKPRRRLTRRLIEGEKELPGDGPDHREGKGEGRGAGVGVAVRSAVCGARTSVEGGGRKRGSWVMRRAIEKAMEAMGGRMGCVGTRESQHGARCATQRGASRMDPCKRDEKSKLRPIFLFHDHRRDGRWVPPSDFVAPPPLHAQRPQKDRRKTAHETVLRPVLRRPLMDRRYTVHPEKGVSIRQRRRERGVTLPGGGAWQICLRDVDERVARTLRNDALHGRHGASHPDCTRPWVVQDFPEQQLTYFRHETRAERNRSSPTKCKSPS